MSLTNIIPRNGVRLHVLVATGAILYVEYGSQYVPIKPASHHRGLNFYALCYKRSGASMFRCLQWVVYHRRPQRIVASLIGRAFLLRALADTSHSVLIYAIPLVRIAKDVRPDCDNGRTCLGQGVVCLLEPCPFDRPVKQRQAVGLF